MSKGMNKRLKAIKAVVACLRFRLRSIGVTKAGHVKCRVTDDAGNTFTAFTGSSCSSNDKKALLNFKQDLKRASMKAKGILE